MKKLITGIALQLASAIAGANHYQSELNLVSTDRNMISVSLDNNYYSRFASNFNVCGIQPGCHYVSVVKRYFRTAHCFPGYQGYRDEVVYNGYLEFPPASRITATLDCSNRLSLHMQNVCFNENNFQNTNYIIPHCLGMDAKAFSDLKCVISNRWFESGKLEVTKQAITNSAVSSSQLAELMSLLSFESSKLELAKFGYAQVVDKQKFFLVNDAFSFESSISELNNYISRRG